MAARAAHGVGRTGNNQHAQRPNILFITADQHRGDCLGFEGRNIKTPHLDRMAQDGTRFSTCITPNVVCQPSRASILTGLLPLTHGVHDNGIDLDPELGKKGFAGALAAAGYKSGFIGKAHFSTVLTFDPTGTPECISSSATFGDDWYGPYMGFQHVELVVLGHLMITPPRPPGGQHYERWFAAKLGGCDENLALYHTQLAPKTDAAQTWHSALPPAVHNSTWIGDRTIDFLRNNKDKPFCLWASFPDPRSAVRCAGTVEPHA